MNPKLLLADTITYTVYLRNLYDILYPGKDHTSLVVVVFDRRRGAGTMQDFAL